MTRLAARNTISLLHITDTHLFGSPEGTLLEMNTHNSLNHVVNIVKQNETEIDFIVATGDIAQDASEEAYKSFMNIIGDLDIPYRWIPGNHDDLSMMEKVAYGAGIYEKLVQINNWQILFLNTSVSGQVYGNLSADEIEFLESSLQAVESDVSVDHCMICLHHNPIKGNAGWMEGIGLKNGEKFFQIITQFQKPKCVVYGHVHQGLDYVHESIRCLCTPSTCIQFKPNVAHFTLDKANPGYRILKLSEDGRIDTKVIRVTEFTSQVDCGRSEY